MNITMTCMEFILDELQDSKDMKVDSLYRSCIAHELVQEETTFGQILTDLIKKRFIAIEQDRIVPLITKEYFVRRYHSSIFDLYWNMNYYTLLYFASTSIGQTPWYY